MSFEAALDLRSGQTSPNDGFYLSNQVRQVNIYTCLFLSPPHTSRSFVGRQKIFTCRVVCGEFKQVCDKIGACQAITDSARSQSVLSGAAKTICQGSRAPQLINPLRPNSDLSQTSHCNIKCLSVSEARELRT